MDLKLKGKIAFVTGGTRGIGLGIATALAHAGVRIGMIARQPQQGQATTRLLSANEQGHVFVAYDLSKEHAPQEAFERLQEIMGPPDIVVNNIGDTLGVTDPYCSLQDWRRVMRINVEIAMEMNACAIPLMKAKQWGRLLHVASNASLENSGPVTYCVAKAALAAYVEQLGKFLASTGIVATSLMPGAIISQGSYWDRIQQTRPDHAKRYILERLPLGRFGNPEEIGRMAVLLCSDQAAWMSSDQYGFDGGQSKHFFGLN